ncbi:MAG: SIS domain-containing protein [Gammaproteobacteria bacterium]|nr:SIS domain-containing protein [Gammaproteobacteria bacterium]
MEQWINNYFNKLCDLQLNTSTTIQNGQDITLADGFNYFIQFVQNMSQKRGKLLFIGNGGSAGIASHLAIDYSKNGHIPALTFSDPSALTCLSNDLGYEQVFAKQIEFHAQNTDILFAISSSGNSSNILNAVKSARMLNCTVVTLSGFDSDNHLRQLGDLNFYIPDTAYGFVEVSHLALGHALLDYIIQEQCVFTKSQETVSLPI